MIEEMVVLLKAEQGVEDSKKAYCLENFDKTEDAKALAKTIVGHEDATQEFQEQLSNTDDRIAVVQQSLAELDDSVAKATEMRRNQHAEFATHSQQCRRDRVAHARRQTDSTNFTSSKLHKAAPKAELSSADRMYVNMSGEITAAAPTGIAGTNVARLQLSRVRAFLLQAPEKSRGAQRRLVTHRVSGGGSGQGVAGGQCGRGPFPA